MSSSPSSILRGSAALLIWGSQTNMSVEDERGLNEWWTDEHLPERLAIPGFHVVRRYCYLNNDANHNEFKTGTGAADREPPTSKDNVSHYLVLYEVENLDTLTSSAYMEALDNPTARTKKFMPVLAKMNRSACNVLVSVGRNEFSKCTSGGIGGTMAHVTFTAPSSSEARKGFKQWLGGEGWDMMQTFFSGVLSIHLLEQDDQATKAGNSTKSYDEVQFQETAVQGVGDEKKWMLMVEFSEPLDAPWATYKLKCPALAQALVKHEVDLKTLREEIYGLVVAMEE